MAATSSPSRAKSPTDRSSGASRTSRRAWTAEPGQVSVEDLYRDCTDSISSVRPSQSLILGHSKTGGSARRSTSLIPGKVSTAALDDEVDGDPCYSEASSSSHDLSIVPVSPSPSQLLFFSAPSPPLAGGRSGEATEVPTISTAGPQAQRGPDEAEETAWSQQRFRRLRWVAHCSAVLALGTADALFAAQHWESSDKEEASALAIVLMLLYSLLTVWLVAYCALPTSWELGGFGLARLPKTWLVLVVTHTSTAFVSSWWREAIRETRGEPASRAAAVASMLQLLVTVLYPADCTASVILAFLSIVALVTIELFVGDSNILILDNALVLLCAGVTFVVAASSQYWADRKTGMKAKVVKGILDGILSPICSSKRVGSDQAKAFTHIDELTKRLKDAKDRSIESSLDEDIRLLFNNVFGFLLDELTDLSSLDRMSLKDLHELPPMTAEYVAQTFGQYDSARLSDPDATEDSFVKIGKPATVLSVLSAGHEDSLDKVRIMSERFSDPLPALPHRAEEGEPDSTSSVSRPSPCSPCKGQTTSSTEPTFNENIDVMTKALRVRAFRDLHCPKLPDKVSEALPRKLGQWHFDIVKLTNLAGGRPLACVGGAALEQAGRSLQIEASRVRNFLESLEARYHANPYHNSMHGADVMNNMLYFCRLQDTALAKLEPIEHLAALTAAAAHDVGHDGFANRFHVTCETPLARLYNDQSPLENMHCTITFTALHARGSNFLDDLEAPLRATFRSYATQMILDTDLCKHIQTLSRFRQELLRSGFDASHQHNFAQRKELATFALKCSDVAHSTKHFDLHVLWTLRINEEFFHQGDTERGLGHPCSPFCDRTNINIAESQCGFYDFIVTPLFQAMDEHLGGRIDAEVMRPMEANNQFWKRYDGADFSYDEPMSNITMLKKLYAAYLSDRQTTATPGPATTSKCGSGTLNSGKLMPVHASWATSEALQTGHGHTESERPRRAQTADNFRDSHMASKVGEQPSILGRRQSFGHEASTLDRPCGNSLASETMVVERIERQERFESQERRKSVQGFVLPAVLQSPPPPPPLPRDSYSNLS